jgi:hypothetical protein
MVRRVVAFVIAAAVMAVLGTFAHAWFVQSAWEQAASMGDGAPATLSTAERMSWAFHDAVNMETGSASGAPAYGLLTGIGLLVALFAAGAVARFTGLRTIVFAVAGAVAMFLIFHLLWQTQGTVYIFGARGTVGLAAQMTVGLISGAIFALLTRPQE